MESENFSSRNTSARNYSGFWRNEIQSAKLNRVQSGAYTASPHDVELLVPRARQNALLTSCTTALIFFVLPLCQRCYHILTALIQKPRRVRSVALTSGIGMLT